MPNTTVILVPGFLGSTLSIKTLVLGNVRLWLSPPTMLGGLFGRLALPTDDVPELPGTDAELVGGGPMYVYYGLLDAYLRSQGWNVVSPYADWRRPLAYDAAELALTIRNSQQGGPCKIVCHSRGGLLVRVALGQLAAAGLVGAVSHVVALGTPHTGSLNAVQTIAGRGSLLDKIEGLSRRPHGYWGPTVPDLPARLVLRSWPALYQLMPDPVRATWLSPAVRSMLYMDSTWLSSSLAPYPPHLSAAAAAWQTVPDVPAGVQWVSVVGYGRETYVNVLQVEDLTSPGDWDVSEDGDGTVAAVSAALPGRPVVRTPTAHDMLPNDGRLWPVIESALNGGVTEDRTLEGYVLAVG